MRHDWTRGEVRALFDLPFPELLHRAAGVHREHFDAAEIQVSTLLSVKTGGCPEDCSYCPQAQRYHTGVDATKLMGLDAVLEKARQAKAAGASRFCMGAAWRSPKDRDIPKVAAMIREVKALGLETCATLGMLSGEQALALRAAGLDYYNHNLDTAPEFYNEIIHTREFQDRLDTLGHVRDVG
ncbi:biotin synthase BioB, partial [Lysobacter sp. A3-1-A15]|uniref:biotin synthase BioB n=1 Tax=Novilysobacter viscosus TaxID=3098602 RepID=UPI002EDB710B